MMRVPLGDTGQTVSALSLGGNDLGARLDDEASFALLDRFFEAGGDFLDTANMYAWWTPAGAGSSESCIGRWLAARPGLRARAFVATKMGMNFPGVERGLRRSQILGECEKSLRRLGVEAIDLYYAHADDRATPLEETAAAFDELVRAGKVRFVGASNYTAWRLAQARLLAEIRGWAGFCCIQQHHTYLRPKPGYRFDPNVAAGEELLDYCASARVTLIAYSPLLQGAYDRPERRWRVPWLPPPNDMQYGGPDAEARLAALEAVARELGATNGQTVLAWMMHRDPRMIPLFGASGVGQLDENLAAAELRLTAEQMRRLDNAGA